MIHVRIRLIMFEWDGEALLIPIRRRCQLYMQILKSFLLVKYVVVFLFPQSFREDIEELKR